MPGGHFRRHQRASRAFDEIFTVLPPRSACGSRLPPRPAREPRGGSGAAGGRRVVAGADGAARRASRDLRPEAREVGRRQEPDLGARPPALRVPRLGEGRLRPGVPPGGADPAGRGDDPHLRHALGDLREGRRFHFLREDAVAGGLARHRLRRGGEGARRHPRHHAAETADRDDRRRQQGVVPDRTPRPHHRRRQGRPADRRCQGVRRIRRRQEGVRDDDDHRPAAVGRHHGRRRRA